MLSALLKSLRVAERIPVKSGPGERRGQSHLSMTQGGPMRKHCKGTYSKSEPPAPTLIREMGICP